jgi:hypothetical protein
MSRHCSLPSCTQNTSGFSTLCELHKRNLRRHGHAEQKGVTLSELQPYREAVTARRRKNPENPAWTLLEARWEAIAIHAAGLLETRAAGVSGASYERQTAEQVLVLRDGVAADVLIDTSLAMFALGEHRPNRFKSDRAFGFQLARRVRGLARVNAGTTRDTKTGRLKRTYRDTPPRVLECLAGTLTTAFGVAGVRLAEMDKTEAAAAYAERQQLHEALGKMA